MITHNTNTYLNAHHAQLKALYAKGYQSQVILSPQHPLYYPSLLKHKFYHQLESQLSIKKSLTPQELCWLIIALSMTGGNFLLYKSKLAEKYGQKWIGIINKWLQQQQSSSFSSTHHSIYLMKPIDSTMTSIRQHYQHLTQRATSYSYFTLKQVPVYLISTLWLQRFYDTTSQQPLGPIDNRHLINLLHHIDTDPKLIHLNYQLKQQMKQNIDYKIVSPDCWKFLYEKFNGIEIKRFTTCEKQPSVQVHYRKLSISILQDSYFHCCDLQLLCSRFTKFNSILQRIKRLAIAYKIVPFTGLKKTMQVIKVNGLKQQELIDLVQDDEIEQIEENDERFEKIDGEMDVEEAKIYACKQLVVVNLSVKEDNGDGKKEQQLVQQSDFFGNVQSLQTVILRDSCLKCGSYDDVFLCICKSVHFCSTKCQQTHKQHIKQCQKIRKQQLQIAKLIKDYDITQRQFQLTQQMVLKYGKVGLQNLRNTCYLNSAIQCLLRVDKLVKYFAGNDHLKDLNVDNVLGSEGYLACAFGQLVKKHYSTNKRSISPIDVIRIIAKNPQFRGAQHQDSQQFLNYFLDKLHEDLNKIKKKPYIEEIESHGRPDEQVSRESWQNYLKRNKSFVQQLFAGQYRSQIRCPDCERISITFDPFMSVTLQFPKVQQSLYIKGYLLTLDGQFLKVQANVPPSTFTQQFLRKTFKQCVVAGLIKNKVIKKMWRQELTMTKNYTEEGILLFYIKQQGWQNVIDLQFIDEKKQLSAFTRRLYIKCPQNLEELKREIYKRLRVPLVKAFGREFQTEDEYINYCIEEEVVIFHHPKQDQLEFPLNDQPLTLRLQFNPAIKFQQKPKLNLSLNSYQTLTQFKTKDFSAHGLSLHDMLQNFYRPQRLTQDNMWYCSKCQDHKMADKIMRIYKLPQILIMHLKRFNHKNTRYRNLIGVEKIQLSVRLSEYEVINGVRYELIGVVNHFGSMTFGHYTAYVKKDEWMKYDDQTVKRCNVNGDSAYLVFYRRCEDQG